MTIYHIDKRISLFLLLFLALFLLAACQTKDTTPTNPINTSTASASTTTNTSQINDDNWNAVAFFATTCASCHGAAGGGSAIAPALNTDRIRTASTDWLVETISNGRSGTAMPAWSVEFGGPLSSEQVAAMATFLQSGDWDESRELAAEQPASPMGSMMMRHGMMGHGNGNGMMGRGMENGRMP